MYVKECHALLDTGSKHKLLPLQLLNELSIQLHRTMRFSTVADNIQRLNMEI